MKRYLLLFFIVSCVPGLIAGVIEVSNYGSPIYSLNASDLSMGNQWTDFLKYMEKEGLWVEYSPVATFPTESRSEYIYDQYDNTVGKQTTDYNSNFFLNSSLNFHVNYNRKPLFVSIGWEPSVLSSWKYEEVERDDFYQVIQREVIEKSISVHGATIRCGWSEGDINPVLFLSWLHGSFKNYYKTDTVESDFYQTGNGYDLGGSIKWDINWRLRLFAGAKMGARFSTPINDYTYPYSFRGGIRFRPVNSIPAELNLQVIYVPWERMEVNNLKTGYLKNVLCLSGGVQHRLRPDLWLRYGYSWNPTRINKDLIRYEYTAGLGYCNNGYCFDIGVLISKLDIHSSELNITGIGDYEDKLIEETETHFILSVSKHFEVK